MSRPLTVIVAVALMIAGGCAPASGEQLRDTYAAGPTSSTRAPSAEPPADSSVPRASGGSHRATVVTDAGRIEATTVDGDLVVDVVAAAGWEYVVERRPQHVRVASTSGGNRVVVDLRATAGGISQEVSTSS